MKLWTTASQKYNGQYLNSSYYGWYEALSIEAFEECTYISHSSNECPNIVLKISNVSELQPESCENLQHLNSSGLFVTEMKGEIFIYILYFLDKGSVCIYGKCYYCRANDTVCPDEKGEIEGAAILYLDKQFKVNKSPWRRSYNSKKMEWETDNEFCK